ncbi:hypothetical protein [Streptomyces panaciradicis]|uniref:hypothetical protein n=1 Tax=Streptomyces panaciradicis TaxID=1470261 RepID=UPI00201D26B6|nr:hypothetical protein [Streptomyces panaciradicis]MCL6670118.1 hypothetical protein [Streptomyces panaciradicis]
MIRSTPGADARFHTVDERIVGRKPASLTFAEATALPLTSLTAWEGLFEHLGLHHGGARCRRDGGPVGPRADQPHRDRHRLSHWPRRVAELAPGTVDFVFSTGTDRSLAAYADILKPRGKLVALDAFGPVEIGLLKSKSISFQGVHVHPLTCVKPTASWNPARPSARSR